MKYVVFMCRTINILIPNWPRTPKFSQILQSVTRWPRSTFNFYALIGQNLSGKFMRKIYAASWILFTLTAEADRVLCQLLMFLTVISTGCTKRNSGAIRSVLLFMASFLLGFSLRNLSLVKLSRKSDFRWHSFRPSPCFMRKKVEKSEAILALLYRFQELHLEW